ncbi:hypothetical protein NLG97_g7733 [Lecanicillium saksenae]|uniref:Uncharacterized protein n=1 Tax=Lecanicillium saksenae TaxID=468837 RepID=A0ACC1QM85_9HYPO|nr:hypothetical protein NLG97_g7733 [Lecanicillium saksenae]
MSTRAGLPEREMSFRIFLGATWQEVLITVSDEIPVGDPEAFEVPCSFVMHARDNGYCPHLSLDQFLFTQITDEACGVADSMGLALAHGLTQLLETGWILPSLDTSHIEYLSTPKGTFTDPTRPILLRPTTTPLEVDTTKMIERVNPELLALGLLLTSVHKLDTCVPAWEYGDSSHSVNRRVAAAKEITPVCKDGPSSGCAVHPGFFAAVRCCFPFIRGSGVAAEADDIVPLLQKHIRENNDSDRLVAKGGMLAWKAKRARAEYEKLDTGKCPARQGNLSNFYSGDTTSSGENQRYLLSDKSMDDLASGIRRIFKSLPRGDPCRVMVIDGGADFSSPLLRRYKGEIKEVRNFTKGHPMDITDHHGHGSHILGIPSQLLPGHCEIYVAKISDSGEIGPEQVRCIEQALRWGGECKIDVVCLALGIYENDSRIYTAISDLQRQTQALVVAAASNNGRNRKRCFPARFPNVFAAHAMSVYGRPCDFNPDPVHHMPNFGVLGEHVLSAWSSQRPQGGASVSRQSGTSVAAAILASFMAALLVLRGVGEKEKRTAIYHRDAFFGSSILRETSTHQGSFAA